MATIVLLILAVLYAIWCAFLFLIQGKVVFPAGFARPVEAKPDLTGISVYRRTLQGAGGGEVEAWFIPSPQASAEHPAPLAVFFHGNAETIDTQQLIRDFYHALGVSLLMPEFRGYGRSSGRPTQRDILADNLWFLQRVLERPDVDPKRVVFHGRSLGAGIGADLARLHQPKAMILQSAFLSAASFSWRFGVPPLLVRHPFRTDRALAGLAIPFLVFHGRQDEIIPVAHGRGLHRLLPGSKYVEYDCHHNDFPAEENLLDYLRQVRQFLATNGIVGAHAPEVSKEG